MKRVLLSTAAIALLSGMAYAADLPVLEAPAPAEIFVPTPVANWSGVYLGVHGGYGWGTAEIGAEFGNFFDDADVEGGIIGGQVGVNGQWNWFVLGAEADGSAVLTEDGDAGANWLASARLRAGVGLDRVLLYGTGGIGFAEFETESYNGDGDGVVGVGWVAGGGAEFMVTDNVTIGAEYLHYEFGDIGDPDNNFDVDVDVIWGRVNVRFGSLFGG